jgi:hypothetical protein
MHLLTTYDFACDHLHACSCWADRCAIFISSLGCTAKMAGSRAAASFLIVICSLAALASAGVSFENIWLLAHRNGVLERLTFDSHGTLINTQPYDGINAAGKVFLNAQSAPLSDALWWVVMKDPTQTPVLAQVCVKQYRHHNTSHFGFASLPRGPQMRLCVRAIMSLAISSVIPIFHAIPHEFIGVM